MLRLDLHTTLNRERRKRPNVWSGSFSRPETACVYTQHLQPVIRCMNRLPCILERLVRDPGTCPQRPDPPRRYSLYGTSTERAVLWQLELEKL